MIRNNHSTFFLRFSGNLLEFFLCAAVVLIFHYPIYKQYFHYGKPELSENKNAQTFYTHDKKRYFIKMMSVGNHDLVTKFNRPFHKFRSDFQQRVDMHRGNDQFPPYFELISLPYPYPPEKIGYTLTGAVVSACAPQRLFDSAFPRLVYINIVLYIIAFFALFRLLGFFFGRIESFILALPIVFEPCLVYISYCYNAHSLCGIMYFLFFLYLCYAVREKEQKPTAALVGVYALSGLVLSLSFLSSPHVAVMFPLAVVFLFGSALSQRKLFDIGIYLFSFVIGAFAPIGIIIAIEKILRFGHFGLFTFMEIIRKQMMIVKVMNSGIPHSSSGFIWLCLRFNHDPLNIAAFGVVIAAALVARAMQKSATGQSAVRRSLLFLDPITLCLALFAGNALLMPLVSLPLTNRVFVVNNILVVMAVSFSLGELSRIAALRSKRTLLASYAVIGLVIVLMMTDFYQRFDGTTRRVLPRNGIALDEVLMLPESPSVLSKQFDEDFYRLYCQGKYRYLWFNPRYLYQNLFYDLWGIVTDRFEQLVSGKKGRQTIDQDKYRRRYRLIESLLERIPKDDARIMKGTPRPIDSRYFGTGQLSQQYFSYYIFLGRGPDLIPGLELRRLVPTYVYFFDVKALMEEGVTQ